jgi:FkbH-like protein
MACVLARKLHAIKQKTFKLIAVDCDNTLWTGVAADDGTEGVVFNEHNILLQNYLVEQQAKGKIICLCSKNDEQTVLDVFNQRQAEMPLKLKHLSKYNKINWNSKSNNIKELVLELNLLPDSFRFIDDNPTEIFDVGQIPGVFCITMPQKFEEFKNH